MRALLDLGANIIAVPPYDIRYLENGHAIHFSCVMAGNTRLDLMSRMRNVPAFQECWGRKYHHCPAPSGP